MTNGLDTANELENILNELDDINMEDLTEEEILKYRKKLNVYGRVIEGSDQILTFSYTNLKENYMKKLLLTGLIGFLNTAVNEYHVPDGLPVIDVYDYTKDPSVIDSFAKDWKIDDKLAEDLEENRQWMKKRVIIKEFLEEMFQYNPDKHIRSVYKPQPKDIARGVIDTPAANLAINIAKKGDVKFREQMLQYDRVQKMINMKDGAKTKMDEPAEELVAKKIVLPEKHYYTMDYESMSQEDTNLLRTACEMIPPDDTFGKFNNYFETNYDKLREAVLYLYCDKPDFDISICPHSIHASEEEADEFIKKHRNEVIADVIKAHTGKWNFFAPHSKVRDTMKFFNDNTIILETIAEQMEKDAKLGSDLMKNRIKQQKKKNIERDGEDAEIFKEWKKDNNTLKDLKAVTIDEDEQILHDAPDDALAVPVYRISNGGLKKSHFYTKATSASIGNGDS